MNKKNYQFALCFLMFFLFSCKESFQPNTSTELQLKEFTCDSLGHYIPFEFIEGSVFVKTKINDTVEAVLMVDNGCFELCLMKDFAEKHAQALHLSIHPDIEAMGYYLDNPHQKNTVAEGDLRFHFGDSVFYNKNTGAFQYKGKVIDKYSEVYHGSNLRKTRIDGILPLHIFSQRGIVRINFSKKRIEFPEKMDSSYPVYPYRLYHKLPIIEMPVSFDKESTSAVHLSVLPDLGHMGGAINLYKTKKISSRIQEIRKNTSRSIEILPVMKDAFLYFNEIKLGETHIKGLIFSIYPAFEEGKVDMLFGTNILSKYDIAFDYKRNCIYLKSTEPVLSLVGDTTSIISGAILASHTKTCTGPLCDNSPTLFVAAINHTYIKADFKVNDIVLKLGKYSISSNISTDHLAKLRKQNDTQDSVTVLRGKDTIVLYRKQTKVPTNPN